jgi:hypothetical protein
LDILFDFPKERRKMNHQKHLIHVRHVRHFHPFHLSQQENGLLSEGLSAEKTCPP